MKVIKCIFSVIFVFCTIVSRSLIFHTVFNSILLPVFNLNAIDFKQAFLLTIAQWAIFSHATNEKSKEEDEFVWFALKSLVSYLYVLILVGIIIWASKYL